MGLTSGTRLGAYEIIEPLGAGGMGEVYKARDTRLDRHVALKLLADGVAGDADRLARFEREARAASALNHPSIVTIYDVGSTDAHPWISMELVEGKTLRELIETGPMPLRRALALAAQIADGLAKAHEAGIIHRDLKPDNVMVTTDGFAKILDFGLARLTGAEAASETETRTLAGGTHPGTVMGTLAYMSPEQASGAVVDFRSDQFSFGAVLYEMLTAQRAFGRASSMDTLSAILRDQPTPIGQLNATIPSPVRWIVERCVEKQTADRYASTRDLARDLATARDRLSELSAAPVALDDRAEPSAAMSRRERLAWALAVGLPLLIGAWLLWAPRSQAEPERTSVRLSLSPPENVMVSGHNMPPFDLSPDGRRLVLVGVDAKGTNSLWVRSLDSLTWQPLAGTDGAIDPFWSFDGREIGFFTAEKILRVPASGGDVQTISNTPFGMGGAWGADGVVLFTDQTGLYRVPASGGTPTQLMKRVADFATLWPRFLPDGRRFLYFVLGAEATGLYMSSVDSPEPAKLVALGPNDLTVLAFTEPDYLLYVQNRNLMAQRLDLEKKAAIGDVIRIAEGVDVNAPASAFSASFNGTVVYWSGSRATSELTWVDRKGQNAGGVAARGSFNDLEISRDGRRLAVGRVDTSPFSIWIVDLARGGTTTRLATDSFAASPVWSPDGGQLAFGSARNSPPNLYLVTLERGGPEEQLTRSSFIEFPLHWSPDGAALVFNRQEPKTGWDLWLAPLAGDRTLRPIFNTAAYESEARISPDGRWMAYVSDESGRTEVYVTSFPTPGDRWKVSSNGGGRPIWRSDVRELYYRAQAGIFAASVVTAPEFKAGSPTLLFEASGLPPEQTGKVSFDVAPDGRFLLNRIVERTSSPMTVITDWRSNSTR